MAWQAEVGAGTNRSTGYRDYLTKLVGFLTSQHVATVVINNGGTGGTFVVGDIVSLTHAGALLDARFEVLTVSAGQILTMRIVSSGAFSNRVATVAIGATAGTGYATNDIVELTTGTSRERCKVQVTGQAAGVPNAVALFETGGAYSVVPSASNGATQGIGPAGFAGDDALQINTTMTGLIGLTGLAVTGGGGTGATVDITLAQTGWAVDTRNSNDFSHNSLTDEKQVSLKADATGFTNKPYVHYFTGTETAGLDTRYFMQIMGSVAHNPSFAISAQPGISPGYLSDSGGYMLFPQNIATDSDFWIQADDLHVFSVTNENPTAVTDDGRYLQLYGGYHDRLKTETEDPYPMLVGASSRDRDANPGVASTSITSLAECRAPSSGPWYYYRSEDSLWTQVKNNDTGSVGTRPDVMFPFGEIPRQQDGFDPETVVADGPVPLNDSIIKRDRTASSRILLPIPGSTDDYLLYPLAIVRKVTDQASDITDSTRGSPRGVFWLYNDDGAGVAINNFSEDFITIGSDRYRVFHNHVQTDRYQFMAVLEQV